MRVDVNCIYNSSNVLLYVWMLYLVRFSMYIIIAGSCDNNNNKGIIYMSGNCVFLCDLLMNDRCFKLILILP